MASDDPFATTIPPERLGLRSALDAAQVSLTIVHHPDEDRVGERAPLWSPGHPGAAGLSRLEPVFLPAGVDAGRPLLDPHVSRRPVGLRDHAGGVLVEAPEGSTPIEVDGQLVRGALPVSADALARGAVLLLGGSVVLLLHVATAPARAPRDALGLVGRSHALAALREHILRVAPHDVTVLLSGESGTGKELVARAIHENSRRARQPFVTVNLAAIPPSTAASALFGHRRGAFTGADAATRGYFGRADGGTLLLDEVGETPAEIQPTLLRALESGEIQPVGAEAPLRADVRVLAATDADLDAAVDAGRMRLPLVHRLRVYEIRVPALRARRDDIGLLLVAFLREALGAMGHDGRLRTAEGRPWLPACVVAAAARYDWPGNVRELRNVARRLAIAHGHLPELPPDSLDRLVAAPTAPCPPPADHEDAATRGAPATPAPRRLLEDVSDEAALAALREHGWRPAAAAQALGLSRTSMYALMARIPGIRTAGELGPAELAAALERCGGDVAKAANLLEVSARGLRLRIAELGLGR